MTPGIPDWLTRWLQAEGEELLYADQPLVTRPDSTNPVDALLDMIGARGIAPDAIDHDAVEALRQFCEAPAEPLAPPEEDL